MLRDMSKTAQRATPATTVAKASPCASHHIPGARLREAPVWAPVEEHPRDIQSSISRSDMVREIVAEVLACPGVPLHDGTRELMETRLGYNFSSIRVHADTQAADAARALGACAFTVGRNIVFAAGQYSPSTGSGRHLLAHELAHAVQQIGPGDQERPTAAGSGSLERQAERAALGISQGSTMPSLVAAPRPLVQCDNGNSVEFDLEQVTPEESTRLRERGIELPRVSPAAADPRSHSDFVERKITAVGYGIYLGGYLLYIDGLDLPVLLPESHVDFRIQNAAPVDQAIYPDLASAGAHVPYGPWQEGQPIPYAYYRGARGALIVPTVFSPATTPVTVATMLDARRRLAEEVQRELTVLALTLIGGFIIRGLLGILSRVAGRGGPSGPRLGVPARIRPVNGKINVGGGFEPGAESASNLQPFIPGTGGPAAGTNVPNLVRGRFEEIADFFEAGSTNSIYSHRLPFDTVRWNQAARGSYRAMAPGGRLHLNVWTSSQAEVNEIVHAFTNAGFRAVRNETGHVGTGTVITGIK